MPAIDIGGNVYRTLADPIYLEDGRQVKEVWIRPNDTGTPVKVYPEDNMLEGTFACKGSYVRTFTNDGWYSDDNPMLAFTQSWGYGPTPDSTIRYIDVTLRCSFALSVTGKAWLSTASEAMGSRQHVWFTHPRVVAFGDPSDGHARLNYARINARYDFVLGPILESAYVNDECVHDRFANNATYRSLEGSYEFSLNAGEHTLDSTIAFARGSDELAFQPDNMGLNQCSLGVTRTSSGEGYINILSIIYNSMSARSGTDSRVTYTAKRYLPGISFGYDSLTYRNFEKNQSNNRFYLTDRNPPDLHPDPLPQS
jgi:hypothetical protein